jgi:hypothetical protein
MRTISAAFRDELEAVNSQDVIVAFATITHPTLDGPITVNSDITDYVYNGLTYLGVGFQLSLVSDDDSPPQARVGIENVDRRIGEALLGISDAPQIQLQLLKKSDFNNATPRVALGTPTVEYSAPILFLRNVQWDAQQISGDLLSYDLTSEPFPKIRCTPSVTPALFR